MPDEGSSATGENELVSDKLHTLIQLLQFLPTLMYSFKALIWILTSPPHNSEEHNALLYPSGQAMFGVIHAERKYCRI